MTLDGLELHKLPASQQMSRLFSWVPVCEACKKNAEGMVRDRMQAMKIERWLQRGPTHEESCSA